MIWAGPGLKVKANTPLTREYWIAQAQGVRDEYGNPFRTITLRWNWSSNNRTSEYEKTQGFEDAIIGRASNGGIEIKYRKPGTIMWQRPMGGVGDFFALCPVTPHNMKKLSACFKNNFWRIVDEDVRQLVEKMWEKKHKLMSDELKQFNEKWFKSMHSSEGGIEGNIAAELQVLEVKNREISDKNLELAQKEQRLNLKEARLDAKEQEIIDYNKVQIDDGVEVFRISERSLRKMKFYELRKMYRTRKLPGSEDKTTKDIPDMIQAILEQQGGDPEVEKVPRLDTTTTPAVSSLED